MADPRVYFVEGLGTGQIASRQALVSPYLGELQLSLTERRGQLEVEVVRARQLQVKAGARNIPSKFIVCSCCCLCGRKSQISLTCESHLLGPYVKVYMIKDKQLVAKYRTRSAGRTLNPLYQERFVFREEYVGCILQVSIARSLISRPPTQLLSANCRLSACQGYRLG